MKRNFTIPIAAALVIYAALLFGFRTSTKHTIQPEGKTEILRREPPVIDVVAFDAANERTDADTESRPVKGDPDAANLVLPDVPGLPAPSVFKIDLDTRKTTKQIIAVDIKLGVPGAIDGAIDGIPNGGPLFDSSLLDNRPQVRVQTAPLYPGEAKIHSLEGRVVLGFTVDEAGRVQSPYVISRTNRVFEKAALRAVSKWRFEPGRKNGKVVRFKMAVPIIFSLNS